MKALSLLRQASVRYARKDAETAEVVRLEPAQAVVADVHGSYGNGIVAEALFSATPSPLASLVGEDLAFGVSGVVAPTASARASNAAMQALLAEHGAGGADVSDPAVRAIGRLAGRPLPPAVLERMNAAFGHDFSHVRLHTSGAAAAASDALHAHAFTVGSDIYFGASEFAPGTREGDRLIAHELTHVVQHDQGRLPAARGEGLDVSHPSDPAEREAYAKADEVVDALGGVEAAEPSADASVDSGASASVSVGGAVALREERPEDEPESTQAELDVAAALDAALGRLAEPAPLAPMDESPICEPEPTETTPTRVEPVEAVQSDVRAPVVETPTGHEELAAVQVSSDAAALARTTPPASVRGVPEVEAAHGDFTAAMDALRERIGGAVSTQELSIRAAADAAKSAAEVAAQAMREGVCAAFEATRRSLSERAEITRASLREELRVRKEELRAASSEERQRVLVRSRTHQDALTEQYTRLAAAARAHGTTQADALRAQAATQAAVARQAGALAAAQYAGHNRANDIRLTCTRMAQAVADQMQRQVGDNASQLVADGENLATKLTNDGQAHVRNVAGGDADVEVLFDSALLDAEATLDETLDESLTLVDDAETQALDRVTELETSLLDQLDTVVGAQSDGLEQAAEDAVGALRDAGTRALDALDAQVAVVEEWLATAHTSQWPLVVRELARVQGELEARAATVVEGLDGVGTDVVGQLTAAGETTVADIQAIPTDLQAQLDQIVSGASESFAGIEEAYADGVAQQVDGFRSTWRAEADTRVSDLDAAWEQGRDDLDGTSTNGLREIDDKVAAARTTLTDMLTNLRGELVSKAHEIANQSAWDRFVSGLTNFALGLLDAVVDFVKTLLIVALVILAVVLVIALVILIVAGAEVLLAAVAAVAAFAAAAAQIVAVVCLVLTVISVVFAVVSVISAWTNPNLTTDERWRATGKGVGDILMEFLPDFGMSRLTRAAAASDAARAVENAGEIVNQADNLADGARAVENVGEAAGHTDELADLARGAEEAARRADDAAEVTRAAETAARSADEVPVSVRDGAPARAPDTPTRAPETPAATPEGPTPAPERPAPGPDAPRNATENSVRDPVDLTDDAARTHILEGDGPGSGGHRHGTGEPGKTEFPQSWSDPDILHHASDVATDPASIPGANNSTRLYDRRGSSIRNSFYGVRDGVIVKVVVDAPTGRIVTAYPVPANAPEVPAALRNAPDLRPIAPNPEIPQVRPVDPAPQAPSPPRPQPDGPSGGPPEVRPDGPTPVAPTPVPDPPGGSSGPRFDPENAPEWLKRYRDAAALRAKEEGIVRPQLQAAYDLFKGFAMSTYQAVNGSGIFGDGFWQNLEIASAGLKDWLDRNEETRTDIEGRQ